MPTRTCRATKNRVLAALLPALWGGLAIGNCAYAQVGSIIQVTTVDDVVDSNDFVCSLREAIIASNTNANADPSALSCQGTGIDSIRFGFGTGVPHPVFVIVGTPLPMITDRVTIAGNTGGATRVVLDGRTFSFTGLHVGPTAPNSTLRFLVVGGFSTAVRLQGANAVLVSSYIGTDPTGMSPLYNLTGVVIEAHDVRVGGTTGTTPGGACTGECNLISGNNVNMAGGTRAGIEFDAAFFGENALIQGNFIGTNVLGEAGQNMGNGVGLFRLGLAAVGGTTAAARNVISGNFGAGIGGSVIGTVQGNYIGTNSAGTAAAPNLGGGIVVGTSGVNVQGNVISGNAVVGARFDSAQNVVLAANFIGTAADGVTSLPNFDPGNGTGHGVWFTGNGLNNVVAAPPAANVIAFNEGDGVRVDGPTVRTRIRYNSIHDNGGLGINNVAGGNMELPPPSLVVETATTVSGQACPTCVSVDIYSDFADEGRVYAGTAPVVQVTGRPWRFNAALMGPNITATDVDENGNTSELTAPVACPDFDNDDLGDALDDSDADGIVDDDDNCIVAPNGPAIPDAGGNSQRDTDGDRIGNLCDADLNNTGGLVNFADLALFRAVFGTASANADFNGDGGVANFADLAIFRSLFGNAPGPSGFPVPGGMAGKSADE